MLNQYLSNDKKLTLDSHMAGKELTYIYLNNEKDVLLYSNDIKELLNDDRVKNPLMFSDKSLSFLLQSGVVPPPNTIYENVFLLGIGDIVDIFTKNDKIVLDFKHNFPFLNKNRKGNKHYSYDDMIKRMFEATTKNIKDDSKQIYLFHSAGKDSNLIALALAEYGWQDRVTLVSYKAKSKEKDESIYSKEIADKLGFKHKTITLDTKLSQKDKENLIAFVKDMPLMTLDMQMAYPLFQSQIDMRNAYVIDGMGNDVYIGHVPARLEYERQKRFSILSKFYNIPFVTKNTYYHKLTKTRSEWTGLYKLNYNQSKKIFINSIDVRKHWIKEDKKRKELDYFDFRADTRGTIIDVESFIRKLRNAGAVYDATVIFPWMDEKVVDVFYNLDESLLFDRKKLRNKVVVRDILKDKIGLDTDALGKFGFAFQKKELWENNKEFFSQYLHSSYFSKDCKSIVENIDSRHALDIAFLGMWLEKNIYINGVF